MRNSTVAVLAWMTAFLAAPAAAQTTLRWKVQEGEQLDWTFHQTTETETGVLGSSKPNVKVEVEMTVTAQWLIESAADEQFTVRHTIEAIRLRMNAPPGDSVVFDSASKEPPDTKAGQELATKMKPLIGAELLLKLSTRGEILSAELSQQAREALGEAEPESLKQMLRGSLPTLPAGASRSGVKWQDESTSQAALGTLQVKRNFTLNKPDGDTQQIDLGGTLTLQPAPRDDGTVVRLRSHELKGQFQFDGARGHLIASKVRQTTVTDSTYRDSRVAVRAESTLVTEVTRK